MIKNIFFALIAALMLVFVGIEDWQMLLIIPIAILNGLINARFIGQHVVGEFYHDLQLGILLVVFIVLVATKVILPDEILLILSFYYAAFEISLNRFRKPPKIWNYVGHTSFIDRLIRSVFKTEGKARAFFMASKWILLFAGLTIYLWNKPF